MEAVSKLTYGLGLQPFYLMSLHSWGFAPGWYGIAPLALKLLRNHNIKGPKARSISAWGNAPGMNRDNESRAESPLHASFETFSLLPPLFCRPISLQRRKQALLAASLRTPRASPPLCWKIVCQGTSDALHQQCRLKTDC